MEDTLILHALIIVSMKQQRSRATRHSNIFGSLNISPRHHASGIPSRSACPPGCPALSDNQHITYDHWQVARFAITHHTHNFPSSMMRTSIGRIGLYHITYGWRPSLGADTLVHGLGTTAPQGPRKIIDCISSPFTFQSSSMHVPAAVHCFFCLLQRRGSIYLLYLFPDVREQNYRLF